MAIPGQRNSKGDRTVQQRAGRLIAVILLLLSGHGASAQSPQPSAAPNLEFGATGSVAAMVRLADGSIIVGGQFQSIFDAATHTATARRNLAKFAADGQLDPDWDPGANGTVRALAVDASGAVYAGGEFDQIGNASRSYVAKLSSLGIGDVDPNWNPVANSFIHALAIDANGDVFVGGDFIAIGGLLRNRLAKLSGSGSGQGVPGFDQAANNSVRALAIAGNALYVGGDFTLIGGQSRDHVAKLAVAGAGLVDVQWNPAADSSVDALAIGPGGMVFVGGRFNAIGGQARNRIAKLSGSGVGIADASWNPDPDGAVAAIALDAGGSVYVGGEFTSIGGLPRPHIAKLSASGAGLADAAWNASADGPVDALLSDPAGLIYAGGTFASMDGQTNLAYAGLSVGTGSLVRPGSVEASPRVTAIALGADGSVYAGGEFSRVTAGANNVLRNNLLKLTPDRDLDPDWNPSPDGIITALALGSDGSVFAAGQFSRVGGQPRNLLAKLAPGAAGQADPLWNPSTDGPFVQALATDSNGNLFVAGAFSTIGGQPRSNIAKLSGFGAGLADPGWNPSSDGQIYRIALGSGSALFVSGSFTLIGGQSRDHLAKLSASGSGLADPLWNPSVVNGTVSALATDASGSVYAGGSFDAIGGQQAVNLGKLSGSGLGLADPSWMPAPNGSVAALSIDGNGALYVGGYFNSISGQSRSHLARLSSSGTGQLDPDWKPGPDGFVFALATAADHSLWVGGNFSEIGGTSRQLLAAFAPDAVFRDGFE